MSNNLKPLHGARFHLTKRVTRSGSRSMTGIGSGSRETPLSVGVREPGHEIRFIGTCTTILKQILVAWYGCSRQPRHIEKRPRPSGGRSIFLIEWNRIVNRAHHRRDVWGQDLG